MCISFFEYNHFLQFATKRILMKILNLILSVFLAFFCFACQKEFDLAKIDISKPFTLHFFEGNKLEVKVSENAIYTKLNKPIIYTFFTSWCETCKVEAQLLSNLNDKFKNDIEIIGVLMEDLEKKELEKYKKDFNVNYKISIGSSNIILDKALGGVDGTPYTILTDKKGNIIWQNSGITDSEFLELWLKKLLENQI